MLQRLRLGGVPVYGFILASALSVESGSSTRACSPRERTPAPPPVQEPPPPIVKTTSVAIELGSEEHVRTPGFTHIPDEQISFQKTDLIRVWLTSGRYSYLFQGPTFDNLVPYTQGRTAIPVLAPGEYDFDRDYVGLGAVVQGFRAGELIGFYHAERHVTRAPVPYVASIGVASSLDQGVTWRKYGRALRGRREDSTLGASGAGLPSAIIVRSDGDYIYLYYNDWSGRDRDAIHLARSPYATSGMPGTWEKFYKGGFEISGNHELSEAVIRPPADGTFAASVNVSYNSALSKLLAVYLSNRGFYFTTSTDGIDWTEAQLLWEVPPAERDPAGRWTYNYPTMISPAEASQTSTGPTGFLYYARRRPGAAHQMYRRGYTIRITEVVVP